MSLNQLNIQESNLTTIKISKIKKFEEYVIQNMIRNKEKINTLVICCDELIAWHNLPKLFTQKLPGYNKFKKIGVEFTNIHCNRQLCSSSRSTMLTSVINTGIQDNIDQVYQFRYIPQLNPDFNTIAKVLKENEIDITAYYGKTHLDSHLTPSPFFLPRFNIPQFNTNTRKCCKKYGFDIYNTFGDTFYYFNHGYFSDQTIFDFKINNLNNQVDYIDEKGDKFIGIMPFLTARNIDKKSFHAQVHFQNPHDTMQFYQNFAQEPFLPQLQFKAPFLKEQTTDIGIKNPYFFDHTFPNGFIQDSNLVHNYFEKTFPYYSTNYDSLPFLESYSFDYATDPKLNSPFAYFTGMSTSFNINFSFPNNSSDISSWKNLINNYYGLIIEVDQYINKIYDFLHCNDMFKNTAVIITADHGDQMSAHGLKQKGFHFKESVNVPFFVYSPYLEHGTSNVLGCLLDLDPTLEVLANIDKKSNDFTGISLLNSEKCENNKTKLHIRHNNEPVLNIYNSTMTYLTYYTFQYWYSKQSTDVQNMVTYSYPETFFEYLGHYSMVINYIDGKQYKFIRFYSIKELLLYNLIFNNLLCELQLFTTDIIIDNISPDILQFITEEDIYNLKNVLISYDTDSFTFNEMYDYIKSQTNSNSSVLDSIILFIFVGVVIDLIQKKNNYNLLIPGIDFYFSTIFKDPNYYLFGYDLDNDPNEIINVLDKNFPERQTDEVLDIFTKMNCELNHLIYKNSSENGLYKYFIPSEIIIQSAISLIKKNGTDYGNYTDSQLYDAITAFQKSNFDS